MFSFALNPQASQRSLGQPWLFIVLWLIDVFRALAACQGLELAGCGGVQGCFGVALATSNARLDLVVSRDEALGALLMVASSLALNKILNYLSNLAAGKTLASAAFSLRRRK